MSEYQYYEFQSVDRRLSDLEMRELRSFSSRAHITPSSFTNEYHFGSFKGNAAAWMEKYFDGFLYLANWGSREVQLALPVGGLSLETARRFCSSDAASSREKSGRVILKFRSEEEPDGQWVEGKGSLSSLLQIRNELVRGDLRSLYIGWLLGVDSGGYDDSEQEPPVPANLQELSGPQAELADFMRLDPDLLHVAAQNSPRAKVDAPAPGEVSNWVAQLPAALKDEMLVQIVSGESSRVAMELQARFGRHRTSVRSAAGTRPRTVDELLRAREVWREERESGEKRVAAAERARLAKEAEISRARYLRSLKGRADAIWAEVEGMVALRQSKAYDQALQHLLDLRDLAALEARQADFQRRLALFCDRHSAKKSLMDRVKKARL